MRFADHLASELASLAARELLRDPRVFATSPGPIVVVNGREVVSLSSNDYLGLASDPGLGEAVAAHARQATGAGASRLITGTLLIHRTAERALSEHVALPDALLFSSGYAANVGLLQALAGPSDVVFSDAMNHASIIDGCRLSRARIVVYRHRDMQHLAELVARDRSSARAAVIVSETVFSMDGDLAPITALRDIADRHDAGLVLDEAHALGVLGPRGAGLAARQGVCPDALVGTLGKAFGLMGAFVAGPPDLIRLLTNRARSFVFSTGISPAIAGAVPFATSVVATAEDGRARLRSHSERLRRAVRMSGHATPDSESCIVPLLLGEPRRALEVSAALLEQGLFAPAIRPPTVPAGTSRLRLAPTAAHDDVQMERACDAIRRVLAS